MYLSPAAAGITVPAADLAVRLAGAIILVLILWWGLAPAVLFNLIERIAAALPLLS